ncbi:MAG: DUF2484 family protein [Pseudomonadota bacterium]
MNLSLSLALGWLVAANVAGMFPSKRKHWPAAYVLITCGLPILGLVYWEHGWWVAGLVLLAACSILRWPVLFLFRWVKRQVRREQRG